MKSFKWVYVIHVFFFFVFCTVSLVNHYYYRTYAHDLGIANQALFEFAHFRNHYSTLLLREQATHYLGLHFSIWVPLLSPFYYLFGSYTLLLFQNLAIVFCAFGIFRYAQIKQLSLVTCTLLVVQFYCIWSLYAAIAFDFHDTVIAIAFVPWLFIFYESKNWKWFALCFVSILFSKENESIWLFFMLLGLIIKNRQFTFKQNKQALAFMLLAAIWFYMCSYIIMPYLSPVGNFEQLDRYNHLGKSIGGILYTFLSNPLFVLKQFFVSNAPNDPDTEYKVAFYYMLLLSGGLAFVFRPYYLLIILPILAQKMLSKLVSFWGINQHYSIEFAPLISLAMVDALLLLKQKNWQLTITALFIVSSFYGTYSKMNNPHHTSIEQEDLFFPSHYQSNLAIGEINTALATIKQDVPLSVSSSLAPHLANRKYLFHFPIIGNAEKIVVQKNPEGTYPVSAETYFHLIDSLKQSKNWQIELESNDILILDKR